MAYMRDKTCGQYLMEALLEFGKALSFRIAAWTCNTREVCGYLVEEFASLLILCASLRKTDIGGVYVIAEEIKFLGE